SLPYNRFVGATIGRPLHLPEFYADNQRFLISNLWFNHNFGGRPMVAPTKCMANPIFALINVSVGETFA
ncbi:MAG TPA: hypothetical protein DD392_01870, partial [Ruminococcus sp.]|nr:hypothetical protein [Ruminococcus sp.]